MCNIHYLKDIAVNPFESRTAELKGSCKMEAGFHFYGFIFSPN